MIKGFVFNREMDDYIELPDNTEVYVIPTDKVKVYKPGDRSDAIDQIEKAIEDCNNSVVLIVEVEG